MGPASSVATMASYASLAGARKGKVILSSSVFLLSCGRRNCLEEIGCDTQKRVSTFWIVFWLKQTV
jgi:hypothetical protein